MVEKMTRWGVGPKFALLSILYGSFTIALRLYYPAIFRMDFVPYWILASIGIILILIGLSFKIIAIITVHRAFNAGLLCTQGVFGLCRHPLYAAWVIFLVPGMVLLMNSWIGLTTPIVMYIFLRTLVDKEEEWLEQKFGEEYLVYKKRTPAVLPTGWTKPNKTE